MRKLLLIALLASCSYEAEKADVQVQVNGISADADHLDVVVTTPGDPTGKTYKPQFQPQAAGFGPRVVTLDFPAPAATGTFTVDVTAADRSDAALQHGSTTGTSPVTPPGPLLLQVTIQ
jgi:hypothetical protein